MPVNSSTWGAAYYDNTDFLLGTKVFVATNYMDACKRAWGFRPRRAEDFHLVDIDVDQRRPYPEGFDEFNGSHDFIVATTQAFKDEIEQRRLEARAELDVAVALFCQREIASRGK